MALTLRPGRAQDLAFLRELAREAFERYGEYDRMLPEWAATPGIELTVAEDEGEPVGLTLLGVFDEPPARTPVADLLAIAVADVHRRRGVGRELLAAAVDRARELARAQLVCALRLTVAESNVAARRLFEAAGFRYLTEQEAHYPRGQRALRMELRLAAG